jgi:hypothetical protein
LEKILNDLFHLHRAEKGSQIKQSLDLILQAMSRHYGEKHVQVQVKELTVLLPTLAMLL